MDSPQLNLNITDIGDAVKVMDFFADQSCFKGWDNVRKILALRDRLDGFVTAATAAQVNTPSSTVLTEGGDEGS